jgi:hypothetical protein
MANDILIIPGQAKIEFSGSVSSTTELQVASNGDIQFVGTTDGLLVNISETNNILDVTKRIQARDDLIIGSDYSGTVYGDLHLTNYGNTSGLAFYDGSTFTDKRFWIDGSDGSLNITIGGTKDVGFRMDNAGEGYLGGSRILTTADTGSGNGLDADTLDGYTSSAFARKSENAGITGNWQFSGQVTLSNTATRLSGLDGSNQHTLKYSSDSSDLIMRFTRNGANDYSLELFEGGSAATVWTSANDGSGSGLDADTLDTYHASAFPRKDENATITGDWTFNGSTTFVDTTTISTGDNIILLNNDVTGTPTENSGLEVERGTETNVTWLWDETNDYWTPSGSLIGNVGDPTSDDHIGDRGYNDARYLNASGDTLTGDFNIDNAVEIIFKNNLGADDGTKLYRSSGGALWIDHTNALTITSLNDSGIAFRNSGYTTVFSFDISGEQLVISGNRVLTVADEGSGNGLDADTLDGQEGSYYLPAASYTAADVLAKLLTVDGSGSGLDADLLDGLNSGVFVRRDNDSTIVSDITLFFGGNAEGAVSIEHVAAQNATYFRPYDGGAYDTGKEFFFDADDGTWAFDDQLNIGGALNVTGNVTLSGFLSSPTDPTLGSHVGDRDYNDTRYSRLVSLNTFTEDNYFDGGPIGVRFRTDGSSDHVYFGFYARDASLSTRSGRIGYVSAASNDLTIENEITNGHILLTTGGTGEVRANGSRVLTTADEGSGNGIDADTLDSLDSTQFLRSDANDVITTGIEITWGSGEGAVKMVHDTVEDRFSIIPYDGGAFDTAKDLRFDADDGYWQFSGALNVGSSLDVATTAHIDNEVQTEKVSIDDTSNNKKFEIVYNAVSDSLDFNFVG